MMAHRPRIVAAVLLVLASPLIAVLAATLAVVQGRPVLFRQVRSGLHGAPFRLVKFRTMRETCDDAGRPLPDEQRVTTVGTALRKTRLDELPSLWNVVTGDLAFIGPRPLLPMTIESLGANGLRRGCVVPGLTGWSQVNGNTLLSLDEKVELDLWYIGHRSIGTDVAILIRTLWVMTRGETRRGGAAVPQSHSPETAEERVPS